MRRSVASKTRARDSGSLVGENRDVAYAVVIELLLAAPSISSFTNVPNRWVENPYFQYFCGEGFFQLVLVFDRSSLTRWRQRMGEEKLQALLQESLAVATRTDAMKPPDLARVVIDTTVQPKAVMFPTDAKLLDRARERLVRLTT